MRREKLQEVNRARDLTVWRLSGESWQDKSIKSLQVPIRQRLQQSEFLLENKKTYGTWLCIKINSLAIINRKSVLRREKAKSSQGTAHDGEGGGAG